MPKVKGLRSGTRYKFAKAFRRHGAIRMKNYLQKHKVGDYVDIIADGAIHKGMPYHAYHGKTARIFNVNKRAVGVIVNKQVKHRFMEKRIHVRIEHLRKSSCRDEFLARVKANDKLKHEAKKAGKKISTKRKPVEPRASHIVKLNLDGLDARNFEPHKEIH